MRFAVSSSMFGAFLAMSMTLRRRNFRQTERYARFGIRHFQNKIVCAQISLVNVTGITARKRSPG